MTYTLPPDSPKALRARVFGDELRKALRTRDVPIKELCRAVGIGHTAVDCYLTGAVLPQTHRARAMAQVLSWPRLATIIEQARTHVCARPTCDRTFINDGGAPKRYCSPACREAAESERAASHALYRAQGQDGRQRADAIARLRSATRIADERRAVVEAAVAAFCAGCEPEGLCRDADCALRGVSPLPLLTLDGTGHARTLREIRVAGWTPERRAAHIESTRQRWARPGERERVGAIMRSHYAAETPQEKATRAQRVSEGRRRAS